MPVVSLLFVVSLLGKFGSQPCLGPPTIFDSASSLDITVESLFCQSSGHLQVSCTNGGYYLSVSMKQVELHNLLLHHLPRTPHDLFYNWKLVRVEPLHPCPYHPALASGNYQSVLCFCEVFYINILHITEIIRYFFPLTYFT